MSFQQGHFYRAFGAWHLRYYCTRTVNGKPQRVQRSRRVCDASHSKSEARQLAAPFLDEINTEDSIKAVTPVEPDRTILKFWTETYEPYIAKHKRANTVHFYRVIWRKHLKAHFGDRELRAYTTPEATRFLSKLAETKGQRTVQHVRSLMSGIYSHAVAIGACKVNPISDCKILGDIIAPGNTPHYTLEEAENIMSALVDHVDAQLIFALSYFAGLRPGEINALTGLTSTQSSCMCAALSVGGVVATPKTKRSRFAPFHSSRRFALPWSCGVRSAATRRAVGYPERRRRADQPHEVRRANYRTGARSGRRRVQDAVRWTARLRHDPQGTHRRVCSRSGRARTRQHSHD